MKASKLMHPGILLLVLIWTWSSCGHQQAASSTAGDPIVLIPEEDAKDYHSFSRPDEARVTHLQLDLTVDFDTRTIHGYATWQVAHEGASELILDTRDMDILDVYIGADRTRHPFKLGKADPLLGQALIIPLQPDINEVTIQYQTRPEAAALQWLSPEQANQRTPFLYTQSQAILARTWVPCQDSPGVRFTYDARVKVHDDLIALMSASNPTMKNSTGVYIFSMNNPIPSYLLALAVGDIDYRPYERRVGVYAQPSMLLSAAYEFMDTEAMVTQAEAMFGPYLWDRYDLLVLPASFPFGGMENPRLSFITPTIIAGDRSLTTLIAHELAHSWSGNLVTNATWNDFWLNEGFTVYLERRIMEAMYGKELGDMLAVLGHQSLLQTLDRLGYDSPDTRLKLHLKGRNPDDGLTRIAYDKGFFFLRTMEYIYGRTWMDAMLQAWFRRYQFQSVTTEDFVRFLNEMLPDDGQALRMEEWIYGTGLPSNCVHVSSATFDRIDETLAALQGGDLDVVDTTGWPAQAWIHFLRHLPEGISMAALDSRFELSQSGNMEYRAIWFEQCICRDYIEPIKPALTRFLTQTGRRKFLTPLYKGLIEAGQLELAWTIYQQARPGYHTVSSATLDDLFRSHGKKLS
jgi:leukotriene-A4 hydrolase